MFKFAIPVLHVTSSAAAEEFYCDRLGFRQAFAYRPFGGADPCYMGLTRDNVAVHVSSFSVMECPAEWSFLGSKMSRSYIKN